MKKVKGKGWVGIWMDGTLGWGLPKFLSNRNRDAEWPAKAGRAVGKNDRVVLCEITVKPIKDKNGKFIYRKDRP